MSNVINKSQKKSVPKKPLNNKFKATGILNSQKPLSLQTMIIITAAVVLIRILLSRIMSHKIDMNMYVMWSQYLASKGADGFYNSSHIVYGPIYMYMLMISGKIASIFSITGVGHEYLVKFWPVLSDFVGGYFIYLIGKKHGKADLGFWLAIFYVLNPGLFMNSSIMGQFDSLPATLLIMVVYFFSIKKPVFAAIMYTIAALTKPQSVFLLPLVGYLFLFQDVEWKTVLPLFRKTFSWQAFKSFFLNKFYILKVVFGFFGVIFTYVITVLPFYVSVPYPTKEALPVALPLSGNLITRIVDLFMWFKRLTLDCSLGDYPYATADGFNFYTLIKGQIRIDSELLGNFISYATLAKILMLALSVFAIWILIKMKSSIFSMFLSSYVLGFGFFMFFNRMHERYLVPAIIFAVVCILWESRLWVPAIVMSLCCFLNQYLLYDMAIRDNNYWFTSDYQPGIIIAFISLVAFAYICYYIIVKANTDAKKLSQKKRAR